MAYATANDIKKYYLGLDVTGDFLKSGDLDEFIAQQDALIDSYVAKRYALPITDATAKNVLKMISEKMTVSIVDSVLNRPNEDGQSKFNRGRGYMKDSLSMLDKIANGDLTLGDATEKDAPFVYSNKDADGTTREAYFKPENADPDKWGSDAE